MIIKDRIPVKSLPANIETVEMLYPDEDKNQEERLLLTEVIQALSYSTDAYRGDYTGYIEQKALQQFLAHANDVYQKYGNEATGMFLGYYLHCPDDESKKVAVATHFFPANSGTSVTCEITHEEAAEIVAVCNLHKVVPLIWPHTRPFNRQLFYSSVDSKTLFTSYSSPHQMGLVCDNLRNDFMGFKIIKGKECHESIYSFDLEKSLTDCAFSSTCLYKKPSTVVFGNKKKCHKPTRDEENCNLFEEKQNVNAKGAEAPFMPNSIGTDLNRIYMALEQHTAQVKKTRHVLLFFFVLQTLLLASMVLPCITRHEILNSFFADIFLR